jgi:hypothetical protein
MTDKMKPLSFKVIDSDPGKYPDTSEIALREDWAKELVYCDSEFCLGHAKFGGGFALTEDGGLLLIDECGNFARCPDDRFVPLVVFTMTEEEDGND